MPAIIGASVQGATGIVQTIAGISNAKQKMQFEQALSLLSNSQQNELNNKLLAANTQTERLQILSSAVLQYTIASQGSADKKQTAMLIVAGLLGVVLVSVALIFSLKKKAT